MVISTRNLALAGAAGLLVLGGGFALAQPPAATPATAPAPSHPVGGYLTQPPRSTHLLPPGEKGGWQPAAGYALYVLDRECFGQCAVLFPPLTPETAQAMPPSADWRLRIRAENGAYQWVYKGKPVYTYVLDRTDEPPKADNIIPGITLARP